MEEKTTDANVNELANAIYELVTETSETNNRITELQEYLITKDKEEEKKAEEEKQAEIKAQEEQALLDEVNAKQEETAKAEESAKADSETQTYTELLTDIRDGINLNNQLFAGQIFFTGVIGGLLFMLILWNRIKL